MNWVDTNKTKLPSAAGALAFVIGKDRWYGCHYGMCNTREWTMREFYKGYDAAQRDHKANT